MINPGTISYGVPHPAWETCGYSSQNVKMAISKIIFLTDTMMTGEKFNLMYGSNPACICGHPLETRFHIILDCPIYSELREFCTKQIVDIIAINHKKIMLSTVLNRTVLAHLILDPSWYRNDIGSSTKGMPNILNVETANKIEVIGRTFCFQVYKKRFNILTDIENDSDSETSCEDSYSIHDTSSEISDSEYSSYDGFS